MGNADASPVRSATATPPSAASRPADSGGFVVQLAAQKSEAEAQATFRTMQAKYSVLGGQRAMIRRKDQGDRGVFYAAQVGPFGTRDEASQLCDSLKSAGGSCLVQKN
jgi:cell division septation protein DedD